MTGTFDLLIVGGGINGAGVARDAAGRGLKVLLVEQGDLAGATSSASTKLIHGGLRYLEQYEFRLVAEALAERERLLAIAPHLIRPLRFVLPHDDKMRPALMIRAGLFLYDHLGRRQSLPGSKGVDLRGTAYGAGLQSRLKRGFVYSDCWGDDARLVVANAMDARERGADIRTRTRLVSARREAGLWRAELEDRRTGARSAVAARALVNATGAWAGHLLRRELALGHGEPMTLVRGSHIVTRRLFEGDHALILQNPDGRIAFIIPYEGKFSLIGTTDVEVESVDDAKTSPEEVDYLCATVNRWLEPQITPADVIWQYAGLRPLHGDDDGENPSEVSRDYTLKTEDFDGEAPVLSIFGGKITTHRALAAHVLRDLRPWFPHLPDEWTADEPMPGGDLESGDLDALAAELARAAPFLPADVAARWARSYGTRSYRLLEGVTRWEGLGADLGAGLTETEVAYLVREEWAETAEDVLWRRSKLGLHNTGAQQAAVADAVARLVLRNDIQRT
jgi:glycerol-3-phosphate dehydrogenase